jgi:DNA (cytosine-5)-methyltransferase 1
MPTSNCFLKVMSSNYKVASLFCGCGGIDLGLQGGFDLPYQPKGSIERLKFNVIWANDFNPKAIQSYRENFPDHYSICGDIVRIVKKAKKEREGTQREVECALPDTSDFDGKDGKFLFYGRNKIDVVTGGFPCQPFSLAGKRKGLKDKRGKLYKAMLNVVKMLRPKLFIAENVAGLMSAEIKGIPVIDKIKADFSKIGYRLIERVFVASNFGIPQRRERVIMIGVPDRAPDFDFASIENLAPGIDKTVTISKGLQCLEGRSWNPSIMHVWSRAGLNKGQGNTTCGRDDFAPTMRAEHHGNIEFHYSETDDHEDAVKSIHDHRKVRTRRLSVREAALIQSFPLNFKFKQSATDAYRQIGNAVPPLLAWHIGRAVQSYLDGVKLEKERQKEQKKKQKRQRGKSKDA